MKLRMVFPLFFLLLVPLAQAQIDEIAPASKRPFHTAGPGTASRDLGDVVFTLDVEAATGDSRILGVEYDEINYWFSGAYDFTIAYLYEVAPDGTLVNKYPQPANNWGSWGWRDLAFDGQYLYAGDDSNAPGYITQIDPQNGQATGVFFGPFPVVPCRGLGYDSSSDSFWTASFTSNIYQCFRDNTYKVHINPGFALYGCAFEESNPSHPMGWWVSQDGGGSMAAEFDPFTGQFTGKSFDLGMMGSGSGACAFDFGGGQWVLGVLMQGFPDTLVLFDLDTQDQSLRTDTTVIESWVGGTIQFDLLAGVDNRNRKYALFGTLSGDNPGTPLPGGQVILPLNWDFFTTLLLAFNPPGFIGVLDGSGEASASLTLPPFTLSNDLTMTFAYALKGPPWDFASNYVEVDILASSPPPEEYRYDDGESDNLLGWVEGGEICWMHVFETYPGNNVIETVRAAFGSPLFPGYGPGNGTPAMVYVWDDPNNDGDPGDGVLLASTATTIQNVDTDILNDIPIGPVMVNGHFIVGCNVEHNSGQFTAPMDYDTPYITNHAWVAGNPGGVFDPNNIGGGNLLYEMGSVGYPYYYLLRAK